MKRLTLEPLEDRTVPATLEIAGGALTFTDALGESNTLTVVVAAGVYSLQDTGTVIVLGSGALSAGWKGSGTNTVSGPASVVDSLGIDVGGGVNTINLRSTLDPTELAGEGTINVSSNAPTNSGNLAGIQADLTITAGASTSLIVADAAVVAGHADVTVDGSGITSLGANGIAINGTLASLTVKGSAFPGLSESFDVASPPASFFRLDCNAGNDSVRVSGDVTGDFYLGNGDDELTVLAGFTLTGNVDTGAGADQVWYGPGFGTITGTVI